MNEWMQLANTTGVAFACLCGLSFAVWRVLVYIGKRALGDDRKTPPTKGFVNEWLDNQKAFHDSMMVHSKHQQELCERHTASMELHATGMKTIAEILVSHDAVAKDRTETLAKLTALHTDSSIIHSPAQAIHNIEQLKLAAMTACNGCREAMANTDEPIAELVIRKCDEIEKILMSTNVIG